MKAYCTVVSCLFWKRSTCFNLKAMYDSGNSRSTDPIFIDYIYQINTSHGDGIFVLVVSG